MNVNVQTFTEMQKVYDAMGAWGILSSLDLKGCDPELIRSKETIHQYIIELCALIKMKRFGEPQIVHFGEDEMVAGYSMTQLINTSLISGHFANATNAAYIDIFSCKMYDSYLAGEFSQKFFKAEEFRVNILFRQ